jgi:glycosyltransferase involved in cell wall biosynthesis
VKRILFISHDANLTGAPILLLHLLGLLKNHYGVDIILKRGGALENEFRTIAPVLVLKSSSYSKQKSFFCKLCDRLSYLFQQLKSLPLFFSCDIIFSNTISNGRLVNRFRFFGKPVVTYVHELESVMQYFMKTGDTPLTLKNSKILLFPSEAVKSNLQFNFQVQEEQLKYLPYFFPAEKFLLDESMKSAARTAWCKKWNISGNAKLVAGMGSVSPRKGTDKFIQIAEKVLAADNNAYFFWIGDFPEEAFATNIKHSKDHHKYHERLIFTGPLPYSSHTLLPFDLFFLSSVEDPYPLVVLEAAYMQVPTICFDGAGGSRELLEGGAGFILPDESHHNATAKILSLLQDKELLMQTGHKVQQKVISIHSDPIAIKNIFQDIVLILTNDNISSK